MGASRMTPAPPGRPSPLVYESMTAYVAAAMDLLRARCPEAPPERERGHHEWVRTSDTSFALQDHERPFWESCLPANLDAIHALPEYSRLLEALRADPDLDPQLDQLVGTAMGATALQVHHVTDRLIWQLAAVKGGFVFDPAAIEPMFRELDTALRRTHVDFVVLAPLLGCRLEAFPIALEPTLEIDRMTDAEIGRALRLGLFHSEVGSPGFVHLDAPCAARVHYWLPKRVGPDVDDAAGKAAWETERHAINLVHRVLETFRLFKPGRVSLSGILRFSDWWPIQRGFHFSFEHAGPMPWFNKYPLPQVEVEPFRSLWTDLESARSRRYLDAAVRRFSYAADRERPDDRLVDLMIAAESLFLSDTGDPSDRGELEFRLAMRAALFVETPDFSRREIFDHMKRAYRVRSAIVHGGTPKTRDLRNPKGVVLSLPDFATLTEDVLRAGLKRAIRWDGETIDWNRLIFS